jgi:hypothetical protein
MGVFLGRDIDAAGVRQMKAGAGVNDNRGERRFDNRGAGYFLTGR